MKSPDRAAAEATDKKNRRLAIAAAVAMDSQRAEDVLVLDLRSLIDFADYFVIASASSVMRIRGIAKTVEKSLSSLNARRLNGSKFDTGWALLDYGDVIVHVFDNAAREHYRIEDLWGDAPVLEWRGADAAAQDVRAGLSVSVEDEDAED